HAAGRRRRQIGRERRRSRRRSTLKSDCAIDIVKVGLNLSGKRQTSVRMIAEDLIVFSCPFDEMSNYIAKGETDPTNAAAALLSDDGNRIWLVIEVIASSKLTIIVGDSTEAEATASASELTKTLSATVPIRLTQTPARCRVRPHAGIKVGIGRRLNTARDAEQRAERVERVETPVEAERELIEVGLQMLRAHAVVNAVEPGLQIGEDEVDHRHELFGNFGVDAFGNCMVVV